MTYGQLEAALAEAKQGAKKAGEAARRAELAATAERAAKEKSEHLLAAERIRVKKLEEDKQRLTTKLK